MKDKFYRLLSILLSVLVLLSVCIVPTVVSANNKQIVEYFVKSPGSDNYGTVDADGTQSKPFETVDDLVTYLNANSTLGEGDIVNINILQNDNITDYNTTTMLHNITSWTNNAASNLAPVPAHSYKIVLKSPAGQNNYLAFSYKINDNVDLMLNGPTEFDNVTLLNVNNNAGKAICLEGNDATFTENCKFEHLKNAYNSQWDQKFNVTTMPIQMSRVHTVDKEHAGSVITLNAESAKLYLPTSRSNGKACTYTDDVKIVVDNPLANIGFVWGHSAASGVTTFNKNLTIDIKAANSITNLKQSGTLEVKGTLQVIVPKDFNFDMSALTNLTLSKTDEVDNKIYIENGTGIKGILEPTETVGVFKVAPGNAGVTVTNENNVKQRIKDGKVTLAPGKYSVSIVEGQYEFFVKSPGSDNYGTSVDAEGTEEDPFETVADAISYINSTNGYDADDKIEIYILQNDNITEYNTSTMLHNMTAWTSTAASNLATVPAHSYKIVLKSLEGQNNYLAFSHKINDNVDLMLNGPTEFDNVTLLNVNNNAGKAICLEGNDATFTENCKFEHLKNAYNSKWDQKFNVTTMPIQMSRVNTEDKEHAGSVVTVNAENAKLFLPTSRSNSKACTYTDDVKIVVNNPLASVEFVWGNPGAGATTFNKNLTFDIKAAKTVTNTKASGAVNINGALQIMVANTVNVSGDVSAFSNLTVDANKYWYIKNTLGIDAVSFTDTAGVFATNNSIAIAVDSSDVTHNQTEGNFTLPAGIYEIKEGEKQEVRLNTYYVRSPGADNYGTVTDADGTKDKPFETIYDLVSYLNANTTFGAGENVNVCILQRADTTEYNNITMLHNLTSWTDVSEKNCAVIPAHKYKLVIKSPEGANNYLAFNIKLAANDDLMLNGPTEFDNVTIVNVRNNKDKSICLEGNDVTFTENCKFQYLKNAYTTQWDGKFVDTVMPVQMSRVYGEAKEHPGSTIILNSANAKLFLPTSRSNEFACTYKDDVKIVVDSPAAQVEFVWGSAVTKTDIKAIYEGNITLDIKSAKSVTNTKAKGQVVINGGLQILLDDDIDCSTKPIDFDNITVSKTGENENYWYLRNGTNVKDAIDFTETAGTYSVKNGMDIVAMAADGSEIAPQNNKLTIPQGSYIIKERNKDYADPLLVGKMIYFKNGPEANALASLVNTAKGKKYILTYSAASTEPVTAAVLDNAPSNSRRAVKNSTELLNEVKTGNYTTYTYRITIPDTYEYSNVFIGVNMPFFTEGYVFNMECYEYGDTTKTSIWKNGDFKKGFDEWIWGWTVVWFIRDHGNGCTEWSDDNHEIRILKQDLTLIDELFSEINDGDWYKDIEDVVIDTEKVGYATLKGTYIDQESKPFENVKMILKWEDKSYTATTDANGNFTFKNIVEGFYELYYVNSEGLEVSTGFAYNFGDGDTVTVKLSNDWSGLIKVSGLSGTVYTPDLKVVSGVKIYLRGFGEIVTDKDGKFSFADVPIGKYDLYTVLEDGKEYVFRTVEIKENIDLAVKLKYDVQTEDNTSETDSEQQASYWIWIVIACGALIIIAAGIIIVAVLKKKKKTA